MWEKARGLCFSPQKEQGQRTPYLPAPHPHCSLLSLEHPSSPPSSVGPKPLLCNRMSHRHYHCAPPALPHHDNLSHWLRCGAANPGTRLPSPASLCTKGMQGRGCAPGTWAPPFPAPHRGLACSVFSAPGTSSGGQGWGWGRELPSPFPEKPLKNVYMPNRM
ncbi:hypothetical protein HJG60_010555 [Phyllostomus discolor]|uniref:Uncharacterized protein n=1 Tax=Phyllostomus discolor TaxID=89673 RepID=A0A834AS71_9CHIR|nr:hypothetical protein HJG60_010555 [Phyllostomus discolor]